jgi:uncharacterized protein YbjQ (UPF0145 family)
MRNIIVTTGNEIPKKEIVEILGVVKGSTVRARNIGRDIGAGLKSLVGGEIKTYTEMTKDARDEAYNRMVNEAIDLDADAIIGVRFTTSMIMTAASEMLAYGTAVKLKE